MESVDEAFLDFLLFLRKHLAVSCIAIGIISIIGAALGIIIGTIDYYNWLIASLLCAVLFLLSLAWMRRNEPRERKLHTRSVFLIFTHVAIGALGFGIAYLVFLHSFGYGDDSAWLAQLASAFLLIDAFTLAMIINVKPRPMK